ncbi:phage portal protein [Methyloversatilis discipulorum]|uniref:phage portal protein n=1 Tax=Methyloversatilis discipulorum TaxID=1119528 RepID=UPI001A5BD339|nr:phage portal protein [Methyloversatilis discipulorum]MBL8469650.1 phage portal protein [Methyloversatilis discipulorum]
MAFWSRVFTWFAAGDRRGLQSGVPGSALVDGTRAVGPDGAMQISTVWGCVWLLANCIASLPLFVYRDMGKGLRDLARDDQLYRLLHDAPNGRMTPVEFWVAMLLNLLLRGNAYARIERSDDGRAFALVPMAADQVQMTVLDDGTVVYRYTLGSDVAILAEESVLHLKEIGNGLIGLSRLEHMRATTSEAANAQTAANTMFANGGKPTGVLMIDKVLNKLQRDALRANFDEIAVSTTSRLHILEADMKYQQVNLSPADQQLLETRRFGVEEICRWFGVPAVLLNHANVTTWGSGVEQLLEGFYKLTVRPLLVRIEQNITRRVLTPAERARFTVEFSFDALLRASAKDRYALGAQGVQNGLITRNEFRQLENLPPIAGGDDITAQTNLAPVTMLGRIAKGPANGTQVTPAE